MAWESVVVLYGREEGVCEQHTSMDLAHISVDQETKNLAWKLVQAVCHCLYPSDPHMPVNPQLLKIAPDP